MITVLLSTVVCTKVRIGADVPRADTTGMKLTTAVALNKRRRVPRLERGPRS